MDGTAMEAVGFAEEIRFSRRSPNSLDYWQRAVATGDGSMLHGESGITGAKLRRTTRRYELSGDSLAYDVSIATAQFALTAHISAELHRS